MLAGKTVHCGFSNSLGRSVAQHKPAAIRHGLMVVHSKRLRAVRSFASSSAARFDGSDDISHPYPQQRQQLQDVQQLQQQEQQQRMKQQARQQLSGVSRSGEETDLLWAGYSALEEQVQKHKKRHEALEVQIEQLQAKLHAAQQQTPASAWQAASFLLFFLFFINFWGMIANFQVGWGLPWAAAKTTASTLWLKQVLNFVVPLTNTAVVLIFCMQAVKAAWTCLKW